MTKPFFILITLVLTTACHNNTLKSKLTDQSTAFEKAKDTLSLSDIRFAFSSDYIKDSKGLVKINAAVSNSGIDTAYFLSWSCDGLVNQLKYDTTLLSLFPHYLCNVSYPLIEKVPPNGQLKFDADFLLKTRVNKIKIGFEFYRVKPTFDLTLENVRKFNKQREESVLWADEKTFQ